MTFLERQIEQARDKLGRPIPCVLQVLTPVHVGSGVKWQKGVDFVVDSEGTRIVPEADLLDYLRRHPEKIEALESHERREDLLWDVPGGIDYALPCDSRELLAFIREDGGPLVPGSSLKGALRTVLFRHFWDQLPAHTRRKKLNEVRNKKRPSKEWDSQILQKAALGKDPNHDLLRALAPSDAFFRQSDLDLKLLYILNLIDEQGTRYGWKNVPRDKTFERPNDATPIYAEMLRVGTSAGFTLRLDHFLMKHPQAEHVLHLNSKAFDASTLARWANRYARARLERERHFLERLDDGRLIRLLNSLDNLIQRIPEAGSDEEDRRFLLRLGWSSGWNAMTGDYLKNELYWVRPLHRLGKKGFPIFPKTRKIVFEGSEPRFLAGWVEIRLNETWSPSAEAESEASVATPDARQEPPPVTLPEGVETGTIHSLNFKKDYGKIQPDDGGEPIRFDFGDAEMTGLNKGVAVVFCRGEDGGEPRAVDVRKRS